MSDSYTLPYIPYSKLKEIRHAASLAYLQHPFDSREVWILLVRQEIDRITIQELKAENNRLASALVKTTLASVNLANEKQKEIRNLKNKIEDARFDD